MPVGEGGIKGSSWEKPLLAPQGNPVSEEKALLRGDVQGAGAALGRCELPVIFSLLAEQGQLLGTAPSPPPGVRCSGLVETDHKFLMRVRVCDIGRQALDVGGE